MAKNGKIEYSDEYRFLEDERVYLIKLYAHGFALDNNAFQVLDIKDLQPLRFKVVSETEKAKTDDYVSYPGFSPGSLHGHFCGQHGLWRK